MWSALRVQAMLTKLAALWATLLLLLLVMVSALELSKQVVSVSMSLSLKYKDGGVLAISKALA